MPPLASPQDDDDGHLTALQIIQDIMRKGQELFLDHFARLGIFSKVSSLAGPPEVIEEEGPMTHDKKQVGWNSLVLLQLHAIHKKQINKKYSQMPISI